MGLLDRSTFDLDSTTTRFILWNHNRTRALSLPESHLAFSPDASVSVEWKTPKLLEITYFDGEYYQIGSFPDGFQIEFIEMDSAWVE